MSAEPPTRPSDWANSAESGERQTDGTHCSVSPTARSFPREKMRNTKHSPKSGPTNSLRSPHQRPFPPGSPLGAGGHSKKEGKNMAACSMYYRTKMCPHISESTGACARGRLCTYAHSEEDLRTCVDLRKTKLCPAYQEGRCTAGDACIYAHGHQELRATENVYKTLLCKHHGDISRCQHGDMCRYAHSESELRPVRGRPLGEAPHSPLPAARTFVVAQQAVMKSTSQISDDLQIDKQSYQDSTQSDREISGAVLGEGGTGHNTTGENEKLTPGVVKHSSPLIAAVPQKRTVDVSRDSPLMKHPPPPIQPSASSAGILPSPPRSAALAPPPTQLRNRARLATAVSFTPQPTVQGAALYQRPSRRRHATDGFRRDLRNLQHERAWQLTRDDARALHLDMLVAGNDLNKASPPLTSRIGDSRGGEQPRGPSPPPVHPTRLSPPLHSLDSTRASDQLSAMGSLESESSHNAAAQEGHSCGRPSEGWTTDQLASHATYSSPPVVPCPSIPLQRQAASYPFGTSLGDVSQQGGCCDFHYPAAGTPPMYQLPPPVFLPPVPAFVPTGPAHLAPVLNAPCDEGVVTPDGCERSMASPRGGHVTFAGVDAQHNHEAAPLAFACRNCRRAPTYPAMMSAAAAHAAQQAAAWAAYEAAVRQQLTQSPTPLHAMQAAPSFMSSPGFQFNTSSPHVARAQSANVIDTAYEE